MLPTGRSWYGSTFRNDGKEAQGSHLAVMRIPQRAQSVNNWLDLWSQPKVA